MTDTPPPAAAPPATPPAAPPAPPPPAAAWHVGLDAELIGHAQAKGWDLSDPAKAFTVAARAHHSAQKLIGVPEADLLRIPKASATEAELKTFWGRLGAGEARDYDLAAVKHADGKDLEPETAEALRGLFAGARVPKDAATAIARGVIKLRDDATTADNALREGQIATEKAALLKNWGTNREANMFVAKQALQKVATAAGIDPVKAQAAADAISQLGGIGAAAVMEMFRVVGTRMGEDTYVGGGSGGNNVPMTRESALQQITELKRDPEFGKKYLAGGHKERQQMQALHAVAYGTA